MKLTRIFSRILCTALCAFGLAASPLAGAASLDIRPLVKVDPSAHYKAVYNIHTTETAAGISKGLYYARGLIEAFGKQGVKPAQLVSPVFRGMLRSAPIVASGRHNFCGFL
jgi:hypothetical protein